MKNKFLAIGKFTLAALLGYSIHLWMWFFGYVPNSVIYNQSIAQSWISNVIHDPRMEGRLPRFELKLDTLNGGGIVVDLDTGMSSEQKNDVIAALIQCGPPVKIRLIGGQ
ncbi:hypothetical protein LBMAG53_39020 [Planctomycetota bacterium]|nr:hypothetical protein LBMAG53_39020 [Planctomycetota bacterium]